MDTAMTVMEIINPNGTVGCETETYRFSATNIDGDPAALLQELNSYIQPMPWVSIDSRDVALKTIDTLPISEAKRISISQHVRKTGYLEDPVGKLLRLSFIGKSRDFTGEGIACWGTFTAMAPWIIPNLIRDYIKALQTENQFQLALPFESKEIRDQVLKAITDCPDDKSIESWGELPAISEKLQDSLINTVMSAEYVV